MRRFLFGVDRFNSLVGKAFGWCIFALTLAISYDVLTRKFLSQRTQWAFDTTYMLYGVLFMMAGAYTLSRNGHVRGDIFYRGWSVRTQARVDLVLYFAFFIPGIVALIWAGWNFAYFAYVINERSPVTPDGPLVWPFKFFIPIAASLMMLQGFAEIIRAIQAIRDGAWPERHSDVEETETRLARESQL